MASPDHLEIVPGTVHLVDLAGDEHAQHLDGRPDIVLVPQPSNDPNDPLNWSRKRKFWALAMTIVYVWATGLPCTLHYSLLVNIYDDTGITVETMVQGNGLMFLFLGWACLFWQPIAAAYGRRGVYIISTLITIPLMVWTAYTTTSGTWYAHRILVGLFVAPIEALPEISVADLFFAHERGTWMSFYVLNLFGSNFVAPLIAGWLDVAIGWRYTMIFGACWAALGLIILVCGMEETMYFRHVIEGMVVDDYVEGQEKPKTLGKAGEDTIVATQDAPSHSSGSSGKAEPAKKKFDLRLFSLRPGRPPVKKVLYMMWLPLVIIVRFPNIAWAGFIYGINLSWYNVLVGSVAPVLAAPPYNWSPALIGSIYVGPIVGAIFGCLWSGFVSDKFVLWLARRNHGIREPEQRLWPLAIAAVMTCAGLILWGVGAAHGISWVGLAFGLGILTFGVVVGGSVGLSYAVDCFKDISSVSMASVIVIRNTLGFALAYAITPWYTNMGLQNCFILAGFISLVCMMSFLVMVWKGKSLRRLCAGVYKQYIDEGISGH